MNTNDIENKYLNRLAQVDFPDMDLNQQATEMAGGMEPEGAEPMTLKQFATTAADVPAGLVKGAIQGTVGLPGDIESIVYGVRELMNRGADESRLDAFLRGLEQNTVLPTTEKVKQWIDTNIGPLVPAGVTDERRREAAKTAEFVGELGGAGQMVVESAKAGARGARAVGGAVTETLQTAPRGSIKLTPDVEIEIAPSVRSKNFKNWFGDSKVVDEKGKPLVVYHGTTTSFNVFKPSNRGAQGPGIYFTDNPKEAGMYTRGTESTGQNIMPVYVSMKNPLRVGSGDNVFEMLDAGDDNIVDVLKAKGYDGIIWDRVEDPWSIKVMKDAGLDPTGDSRHFVVFDPKQIKSAIGNKGTFDPKDPNITRGVIAAPAGTAAADKENE